MSNWTLPFDDGMVAGINITLLKMDHETMKENIDHFFLLLMGAIIFFMQCGFAFLECGSVRMGNATNILFKNVMDAFVGAVCYWACGYAFAFGEPSNEILGHNYFFAHSMEATMYPTWFFQFSFAATASTIVSGAVAERMEMGAYLLTSSIITAWIYPVVTHWTWGGGWLGVRGYQDFAGSGVVHMCGGSCALIGAAILGPRVGRFDSKKGSLNSVGKAHSIPYVALGAFILYFGFLAFNGGSVGAIVGGDSGVVMARAMVVTILSGSIAGMVTLILHMRYSLTLAVNGSLAGMVAACAGCNAISLWAAAPLGALAAVVYSLISNMMQCLRIDDPLDAVAVHLGGGTLGILYIPFFDITHGIIYHGNAKNAIDVLKWNAAGAGAIFGWSIGHCIIIFGILRMLGLLRVKREIEIVGMDEIKHGESAYPDMAYVIRANGEMLMLNGQGRMISMGVADKPVTIMPVAGAMAGGAAVGGGAMAGGMMAARHGGPAMTETSLPPAVTHPNAGPVMPAGMYDETLPAVNRPFNPRVNGYM